MYSVKKITNNMSKTKEKHAANQCAQVSRELHDTLCVNSINVNRINMNKKIKKKKQMFYIAQRVCASRAHLPVLCKFALRILKWFKREHRGKYARFSSHI